MNKKVAVALSGGVDSAVTALLLKNSGYDVVGITGKTTCSKDAEAVVSSAKKVAEELDIPHYAVDVSKDFNEKIIEYFEQSYQNGQTPNPCIMCNKYIKWGVLFDYAINQLGADYIATGHYARINFQDGAYKLFPAEDEKKDQLYFLFMLNQQHLEKTLFPLSDYKKEDVKKLAVQYNLPPKSSKESQDICFIKYPMTTKKYLNNIFKPQKGDFIEIHTNKVLGHHDGYWQYTIGQRKGIGIAYPQPLYVTDLDSKNNTVYLGLKEDLLIKNLELTTIQWSHPFAQTDFDALVKVRYNMNAVKARVSKVGDKWNIDFAEEISAPAKGQACVLYDITDGHLLGGSFI